MSLTLTAGKIGGGTVILDRVTRLTVNDALASPAAALSCRALIDGPVGELGEITADWDGMTLFTGRVDRQAATISGRGRVLAIEARSRGALLLDNEALPCVLSHVGLDTAYRLFLAPYGFDLATPGDGRAIAAFTVRKGQSEWEAFAGFTRRAYGHSPYLRGDRVFVGAPRSPGMLTVGEGGYPFSVLEHEHIPYRIVSRVILRDADGNYTAAVQNPDAAAYEIDRKRYVIPANEFSDNVGLDANQRVRRSMLEKERVTVTLPGIIRAEPGQDARILGGDFAIHNLMAEEITWSFTEGGIVTVLGLVAGMYYD